MSDSPFETVESRQHVNDAFRSGIPALKRCPNIWQKFYGIYLNKIGEKFFGSRAAEHRKIIVIYGVTERGGNSHTNISLH